MKILIVVTNLILAFSCTPPKFDVLLIQNNSNKSICYSFSSLYPDTTIPNILNPFIPPNQKGGPYPYGTAANGIVEVFIFDKSIVETMPWDSIVKKYLILKRYNLTIDSIGKMGGVINYP